MCCKPVGVDDFKSYLPLRGLATMRESVAHRFREDFGLEYDPDGEIVISSGAGESLWVPKTQIRSAQIEEPGPVCEVCIAPASASRVRPA